MTTLDLTGSKFARSDMCFVKMVLLFSRRSLCYYLTSSRVCITIKNSPNPSSIYIRLCKHRKKVLYCFYKITFPRKKNNSLFRLLIKREILTSREVLYTKLNVRVISSCFAIKILSKSHVPGRDFRR